MRRLAISEFFLNPIDKNKIKNLKIVFNSFKLLTNFILLKTSHPSVMSDS